MANLWLQQTDLSQAISEQGMVVVFDDIGAGQPDPTLVQALITRAEQLTQSWLIDAFGPPPLSATVLAQIGADPFLKSCAIECALVLMLDRRPEYFRASTPDIQARWKRWEGLMQRVLDARQRATTVATPPANVGGAVVDNANRLYVDSPGGPAGGNAGDY